MPTLTLARLVLVEASRRRLLLALAALTLAVIAVLGYGFGQLPRLAGGATQDDIRQAASFLQIFAFFMFSFVLTFAAVFTAAPAIAGDLESGVMLAIVPRPIRRSEIVIGRWLGLCTVVTIYTVLATTLEMVVVRAVVGYLPPGPAGAVAYLVAEGVVAVTLGLLLSTRLAPMTGGIIATVLLLVVWFGGIIGNVGYAFGNDAITTIGIVARLVLPTDGLWHGALYFLQTPEFLAAQHLLGRRAFFFPFFASDPPPAPYLVWVAAWVIGMLALTIASFRAREL
jgi:ABC-type transport system involved in multi-copper enzyme maturation permease subunit